jgi:hypothetical protein
VHWLIGDLYVGFSCLPPTQINEIAAWHMSAANGFRDRFWQNMPPLLTRPLAMPGGTCRVNLPPDCSTAVPSVFELWPPNHQFRRISISGVTDPDGDPVTITINSIFQDERVKGGGSGSNCADGDGVGTDTAQVRADRAPTGDGRVYHIGFTADDGKGGTCTGKVKVCVPHDQGKGKTCVDQGSLFDSTVCQ